MLYYLISHPAVTYVLHYQLHTIGGGSGGARAPPTFQLGVLSTPLFSLYDVMIIT